MSHVTIQQAPKFGWLYVGFPFHAGANKLIKQLPGTRWENSLKKWVVPIDCQTIIKQIASWAGFTVSHNLGLVGGGEIPSAVNPALHEYQKSAVAKMLSLKRAFLNFEMGLGKTPTSIEALRLTDTRMAVIVCPAIVRQVWADEFKKWWPEAPAVDVVSTGKEAKEVDFARPDESYREMYAKIGNRLIVTSYELLGKLNLEHRTKAIIFDEAHYLKNPDSKRTKYAKEFIKAHKPEYVWMLTGTPIANEPIDLWSQGDALIPGMYGKFYHFRERYADYRPNEYAISGKEYFGLNKERGPELALRLQTLSIRKTKAEVKHLLPKLTVTPIRVKVKRNVAEALKRIEEGTDLVEACSNEKIGKVAELLDNTLQAGASHVVILTHLKRTAKTLAELTGGALITGDTPVSKRHELIKELTQDGSIRNPSVLCATMHSLGTGLSLNAFTEVIYAELDYRHSEVSQSMARYHRVSGTEPVNVQILVLEGTHEEAIAYSLSQKLENVEKVVGRGEVEDGLSSALQDEELSDEDLREIAEGML